MYYVLYTIVSHLIMSLTIERKEGEFFSGLIIVRSLPYHKFWILKYQIIKVDSSASVRLD